MMMAPSALRRLAAALAAVLLAFSMAASALAQPRYPEKTEPISDYADIFSASTVADLKTFRNTLQNKTGVGLWVTTVHFLDGVEMPEYAKGLFTKWGLGDEDLLLVLSAGEESFDTVAGASLASRFPEESQQHLLTAYLQADFQSERYDQAIAAYIPALANMLGKQYDGVQVSTDGLFGRAAATPTPAPTLVPSGKDLADYLRRGYDTVADVVTQVPARSEEAFHISFGSMVVLVILFLLVFGRRCRHHRGRPGCAGCGCGPLGWIFTGLGLGELFQHFGRRS